MYVCMYVIMCVVFTNGGRSSDEIIVPKRDITI